MLSKARQKITDKVDRDQKCSILGPQNFGLGGPLPPPPPDPYLYPTVDT